MFTALVRTVKHDPNLSNDEVDGTATAVEEDIFRRAAPQDRAIFRNPYSFDFSYC